MAEVHVNITSDASNNQVMVHNPGVHPLAPNAGKAMAVTADASGKTIATHGQVTGTGVVHNNPA